MRTLTCWFALLAVLALALSAHAAVLYLRCRAASKTAGFVFVMGTYDRATDCESARTGTVTLCKRELKRGRRVQIDCEHCICAPDSWIMP